MKEALKIYAKELEGIRESGTYKEERFITTPQRARIDTTKARDVVNMCANNYLGLADNPEADPGGQGQLRQAGATAFPPCASSAAPRQLHKELEAARSA